MLSGRCNVKVCTVLMLLAILPQVFCQSGDLKFTHFYIDYPLEPATWGTGGFTVNDFDHDGDMDITIQRYSTGMVYWYQNTGNDIWKKYEISSGIYKQLGAVSIDVNGDSYYDLVMGSYWLENPGTLKENPDQQWIKHKYNGGMTNLSSHDIAAADINHDGIKDIISYCQNANNYDGVMRWYDLSDPYNWKYYNIDTLINKREKPTWNKGVHGGFAPNGVADLNNDGWNDIVMPQGWYQNGKSPETQKWILHRWSEYGFEVGLEKTLYGTSIRSYTADLDNDGDMDIVYTDCDNEESKAYIIYNIKNARKFELVKLPFPQGPSGSLHSLGVADLDGDGDLDIFSGEQEDSDVGMKQKGMAERGIVWINTGTIKKPEFKYQIINTDNPGWHDTILKDMDGDGDIDLVTKVWKADEGIDGNSDAIWHISLWKNESK